MKTRLFDSTWLHRGQLSEPLLPDLSQWLTLSNIELEIIWIFNTAAFTANRSKALLFISNLFLMAWIYIDIIIVEWWALIFTLWHKQICRIFTMFHLAWWEKPHKAKFLSIPMLSTWILTKIYLLDLLCHSWIFYSIHLCFAISILHGSTLFWLTNRPICCLNVFLHNVCALKKKNHREKPQV